MKLHIRKLVLLITATVISLYASLSCAQMQSIDFQQLFVGFNGPRNTAEFFYRDRASLEKSWVRHALTDVQFEQLLAKVDFKRHIILAFALGEKPGASGTVKIKRIGQFNGKVSTPMDVSVMVGVVGNECSNINSISYPFVVAIFDAPKKFEPYGGFDAYNFRDGDCKTSKSESPTEP